MASKRRKVAVTETKSMGFTPIVQPSAPKDWSEYQRNIFDAVKNKTGHYVVMALAGSGKTTTIIESLNHIPDGKRWLLVAFNKNIAEELKARAPVTGDVMTLHSLGLKTIMRAFGKVAIESTKMDTILATMVGDVPETRDFRNALRQAVSLCKGYLAENVDEIDDVLDRHGVDAGKDRDGFIDVVQKALTECRKQDRVVDFDDMLYFVHAFNLKMPQYDIVFVDETQDLNRSQLEMVMKCVGENGRIFAVGDSRQALYAFRGADSDAIQRIIDRTNANVLPLSVTYRCAKKIVSLANTIVPDLKHAPTAPEGEVVECDETRMRKEVGPGDFVLSRTNAPLVGLALAFLREGKPCNIQGRDIGSNLMTMIRKSKCKKVDSFIDYMNKWKDAELARLMKKRGNMTNAINAVYDKTECLLALCSGAENMDQVKGNIERLFSDTNDKNRIVLSTVHKAKGLERDRVWILNKTFRRGMSVEEDNIFYVAVTRAKNTLMRVS